MLKLKFSLAKGLVMETSQSLIASILAKHGESIDSSSSSGSSSSSTSHSLPSNTIEFLKRYLARVLHGFIDVTVDEDGDVRIRFSPNKKFYPPCNAFLSFITEINGNHTCVKFGNDESAYIDAIEFACKYDKLGIQVPNCFIIFYKDALGYNNGRITLFDKGMTKNDIYMKVFGS